MNQLETSVEAQAKDVVAGKERIEMALPPVDEIIAFLWRSIGKNVRRLREAGGLTQELLAEMTGQGRFGVSVRTIARLEAGKRVSDETLKAIAGALDVSLDALSQIEEREPEITEADERTLVRKFIAEHKVDAIAVTLRRAEHGGRDLILSLNASQGLESHYDPPSNASEEDAIAEFVDALNDWILGWSDLSVGEQFAARRQFDNMLERLAGLGYRLYLGRCSHVWFPATEREFRVPTTVALLSKRTISRFVGLFPKRRAGLQ